MRRISRTVTLAGVFLAALSLGACDPASQEAGETNTTGGGSGGTGGTTSGDNLSPEKKYLKMLDDCAAASKGTEPLAKISDAVALINKMPKPLSIPCFMAAIPRPFELTATVSSFSAQPAKDKNHPRFIIHTKGLLITVAAEGFGKTHVEFGELRGTTESVKGDLVFPVEANVGEDAPYVEFFNKSNGQSSCALCHSNERLVGNGYPAEATLSKALAPPPDKLIMRYEVEEQGRNCEGKLTVACILTRSIFYGSVPAEYKIPADMPIPSSTPTPPVP